MNCVDPLRDGEVAARSADGGGPASGTMPPPPRRFASRSPSPFRGGSGRHCAGGLRFGLRHLQRELLRRRDAATAHAVAAARHPGRAEAELLQHPARGRIVGEVAGDEPLQAQRIARIGEQARGRPRWRCPAPRRAGRSSSRTPGPASGVRPKPIPPTRQGAPSVRRKMRQAASSAGRSRVRKASASARR